MPSLVHPWVSPEVIENIVAIGLDRIPYEACGIVTPTLTVIELENGHDEPHHAYQIRGADLAQAMLTWADESGLFQEDLGDLLDLDSSYFIVWHTHPNGQVGPSKKDLESRLHGFQYLVVSLPDGLSTIF